MNFVSFSIRQAAVRIRSFDDQAAIADRHAPIVIMFSGGLDSTYPLYKLEERDSTHINAAVVNVGEPVDRGPADTDLITVLGAQSFTQTIDD